MYQAEATRTQLDPEDIKGILTRAAKRELGLVIRVTSVCRRPLPSDQQVVIKNVEPSVVRCTEDGRIGFCVKGVSYITLNESHGTRFMDWIIEASQPSTKGHDYGQPKCHFDRCSVS